MPEEWSRFFPVNRVPLSFGWVFGFQLDLLEKNLTTLLAFTFTRFPTVAETPIFVDFCFLAVSAAVFWIFLGLLAWCLGKRWISSDEIDYILNFQMQIHITNPEKTFFIIILLPKRWPKTSYILCTLEIIYKQNNSWEFNYSKNQSLRRVLIYSVYCL